MRPYCLPLVKTHAGIGVALSIYRHLCRSNIRCPALYFYARASYPSLCLRSREHLSIDCDVPRSACRNIRLHYPSIFLDVVQRDLETTADYEDDGYWLVRRGPRDQAVEDIRLVCRGNSCPTCELDQRLMILCGRSSAMPRVMSPPEIHACEIKRGLHRHLVRDADALHPAFPF